MLKSKDRIGKRLLPGIIRVSQFCTNHLLDLRTQSIDATNGRDDPKFIANPDTTVFTAIAHERPLRLGFKFNLERVVIIVEDLTQAGLHIVLVDMLALFHVFLQDPDRVAVFLDSMPFREVAESILMTFSDTAWEIFQGYGNVVVRLDLEGGEQFQFTDRFTHATLTDLLAVEFDEVCEAGDLREIFTPEGGVADGFCDVIAVVTMRLKPSHDFRIVLDFIGLIESEERSEGEDEAFGQRSVYSEGILEAGENACTPFGNGVECN